MTHRERLLATLDGRPVDRLPDYEFGAWDQTYPRWHAEGMPREFDGCDAGITRYFHTDEEAFTAGVWINVGLKPGFTEEILERHGTHLIKRDADGATVEMLDPARGASIPKYLRYAVETREDWERLRDERLRIGDPGRLPADLVHALAATGSATTPVVFACGSLYGWLRNWIGVERFSELFVEDPAWVDEMMEHLTLLVEDALRRIAGRATIDLGTWWEDMCFKNGPLISPAMFARFMVPRYRRVTEFMRRECGTRFHMVDCDGRVDELAPLWAGAGINVMFPMEVPHTDAPAVAGMLGARGAMRGGFDKRALIAGPAAIDAEFDRLAPLLRSGRFIPHTDHRVPPDVSLEHYRYYRRRKCEILGKEYREG